MSWVVDENTADQMAADRAAAMAAMARGKQAAVADTRRSAAVASAAAQRAKTLSGEDKRAEVRAQQEAEAAAEEAAVAEAEAAAEEDADAVEGTGEGAEEDFEDEQAEVAAAETEELGVAGRWKHGEATVTTEPSKPDEAPEGRSLAPGVRAEETYSYEDLRLPDSQLTRPDIDPTIREAYLDDDEFFTVFEMDREAWAAQPKWRRDQQKKSKGLF
eukprot:TRINITY_DN909_c0_g1_i2.p1 TRINITY_DN909_c0_g1~~TRINITY_DN909_c0_g1_i2.p1  ORF type:complete len:216 (-),score=45.60 TRINITY_DN909_c0_g1_i2:1051-1698(-)